MGLRGQALLVLSKHSVAGVYLTAWSEAVGGGMRRCEGGGIDADIRGVLYPKRTRPLFCRTFTPSDEDPAWCKGSGVTRTGCGVCCVDWTGLYGYIRG